MKRFLFTAVLCIVAMVAATAQKGMNINTLFSDEYQKRKDVSVVTVRGAQVKAFDLWVFRSFTVSSNPALASEIERLVRLDGRKAKDREVGTKGGKLYYAFYSFPKNDGSFNYIFYRNNLLKKGAKPETTVVYMEGTASLVELKKMFGRK